MKTENLNKRIAIWRNGKATTILGESGPVPQLYKSVWAAVIPQTGNMARAQADTMMTTVTTKIVTRYQSAKDVLVSDFIKIGNRKLAIKYILDPYERHEWLEFFCEEVK